MKAFNGVIPPAGNSARYGMSPSSTDNTAAFNKAVEDCVATGRELEISPGFYYFKQPPATITGKLTIRNGGTKGDTILFRDYDEATPTNGFITVAPTTEIATFSMNNVYVYTNTGCTGGTALKFMASANGAPDYSRLHGVVVTGLNSATWDYPLYADGSARANGLRDMAISDSFFFNGDVKIGYMKSIINWGLTNVGFYPGSGASNAVSITGDGTHLSQNTKWMGGYIWDLDLDYCRHNQLHFACPVQTITNTANVDYTIISASSVVTCQRNWSATSCELRVPKGTLVLPDGITAPSTLTGMAQIYVDTADGDLKVIFGDGTVKTIVVDT